MTRNRQISHGSVTDPIKVALLTDDPLLRAGLSSLLAQDLPHQIAQDMYVVTQSIWWRTVRGRR